MENLHFANYSTIILNGNELFQTLNGHTQTVSSLAVLANVDLASGSSDSTIRIWNIYTGLQKSLLENVHTSPVTALFALKNGNLVSGSADGTINIWNLSSGLLVKSLIDSNLGKSAHTGMITSFEAFSNGDLVSSSSDSTIKIWDTNTDSLKESIYCELSGPYKPCLIAIIPTSGYLVYVPSINEKIPIRIWKSTIEIYYNRDIKSLCSVPNSYLLASGHEDGSINIWNTSVNASVDLVKILAGHSNSVDNILGLQNRLLASVSRLITDYSFKIDVKLWKTTEIGNF